MQNNLSRNSSLPNISSSTVRNQSGSFKRLGNSIISSGKINSFTVKNAKSPETQEILPAYSPQVLTPRVPRLESVDNDLKYSRRDIKAAYPPGDLKYSVFAIYDNGNSYDPRKRNYGMPKGVGILINEHLCLTGGSVFTDENSVINSFAQLKDGSVFKFDPYRAFVIVKDQFAIVAFRIQEAKVLEKFRPVSLKVPFELTEKDPVFYFPLDPGHEKIILVVSSEVFTITSGRPEYILPGNPIFTVDWKIQGIYMYSQGDANIILKIKPILEYLENSVPLFDNPILEKYVNQDKPGYVEKFHDRHLYYFEWGTVNIWRYDIDLKKWNPVKIHNLAEFSEENELWSFPENSRLIYLPNGSVMCIGGRSKNSGVELRLVYEFCPQEYQIIRQHPEMIVPRDGPSCVYVENYIYVFGGTPSPKTCEKYSMVNQRWYPLSSMYYPRQNAAATSALSNDYIFVFGGEPLLPSGIAIERYSIKFNHWELLTIQLPKPLAKIGVFPITNRRIAILGGTESNLVFILTVEDLLQIDGVNYTTQGENQHYSLRDCLRSLENITETVFPIAFSRTNNVLYILNSYNSSTDNLSFSIEEYSIEYFEISTSVDYTSKPAQLIAKVRTPYDLGRTWKNDLKLRMIK
jgi:Kelch motif